MRSRNVVLQVLRSLKLWILLLRVLSKRRVANWAAETQAIAICLSQFLGLEIYIILFIVCRVLSILHGTVVLLRVCGDHERIELFLREMRCGRNPYLAGRTFVIVIQQLPMQQALGAHVLVIARAECKLLDFTITNAAIHSLLRVFLVESRIFPEFSLDNWRRVASSCLI